MVEIGLIRVQEMLQGFSSRVWTVLDVLKNVYRINCTNCSRLHLGSTSANGNE